MRDEEQRGLSSAAMAGGEFAVRSAALSGGLELPYVEQGE
jgi:hypothetical protein